MKYNSITLIGDLGTELCPVCFQDIDKDTDPLYHECCPTCYEYLGDRWLPPDLSWFLKTAEGDYRPYDEINARPPKNPSYTYNIDFYTMMDWNADYCMYCGSPDGLDCDVSVNWHDYTPYSKYVALDMENGEVSLFPEWLHEPIPLRHFYRLESHVDTDKHMPMDCRTCLHFNTHCCEPMMQALDEIIYVCENNSQRTYRTEAIMEEMDSRKLVPCAEYVHNDEIRFRSNNEFCEYLDNMAWNYGQPNIRDYIHPIHMKVATSPDGTHHFEETSGDAPSLQEIESIDQPFVVNTLID